MKKLLLLAALLTACTEHGPTGIEGTTLFRAESDVGARVIVQSASSDTLWDSTFPSGRACGRVPLDTDLFITVRTAGGQQLLTVRSLGTVTLRIRTDGAMVNPPSDALIRGEQRC